MVSIHTVLQIDGSAPFSAIAEVLGVSDQTVARAGWVGLTSGGSEIVCVTRSRSPEERNALLLGKLPHTPRVVAVTAR